MTLRAPAQFFATKLGEEAQTRPAEYLATSAIMSKGHHSLECRTDITLLKQCSLPVRQQRLLLTKQSVFAEPKFTKHHLIKAPLGRLGQSSITEAAKHSCCLSRAYHLAFKTCRGCTRCRNQVLISVSAAPPNFWPD